MVRALQAVQSFDWALSEVLWDGPAYRAGLAEGSQLVAVNGQAYSADELKEAIRLAQGGSAPIELLVRSKDSYRTVHIDDQPGLRYPKLERIPGAPPLLDATLAARR